MTYSDGQYFARRSVIYDISAKRMADDKMKNTESDKRSGGLSRRQFIGQLALGAGAAMADTAYMLKTKTTMEMNNHITCRMLHDSVEKISLLGFGMMRLPVKQDEVNRLVDYVLVYDVNYFDGVSLSTGCEVRRKAEVTPCWGLVEAEDFFESFCALRAFY